MKVIKERVETLVRALMEVELTPAGIDMSSIKEPTCRTPGCHAGLIFRALPGLGLQLDQDADYSYITVSSILSEYLMGDTRRQFDLLIFAAINPEWWGNDRGEAMFVDGAAFGMDSDAFPEKVIVDHWVEVAKRGHLLQHAEEV
jgi:hypothetical protein